MKWYARHWAANIKPWRSAVRKSPTGCSVRHDHLATTEIYLNLSPEHVIKEFMEK